MSCFVYLLLKSSQAKIKAQKAKANQSFLDAPSTPVLVIYQYIRKEKSKCISTFFLKKQFHCFTANKQQYIALKGT